MKQVMSIVERKQARASNRKVWDVYHSGISEVSVLEITMTKYGISIADADGRHVGEVHLVWRWWWAR